MRLFTRLLLAIALLAAGLAGQASLARHLAAAGPLPAVRLERPLVDLPRELGPWRGRDEPITDERHLYADEHLQRVYRHGQTNQVLSVWMAYSRLGADRGHHPEVCMAVAGKPEDASVRQTIEVAGHAQGVQQYRFGRPGESQWVFYWYYTLPPPPSKHLDPIQHAYQRLRRRPSSATIEVFAPEYSAGDAEAARQFVVLLDAAVQAHVGPGATRGSRRMPVTVVPQEAPQ